MITIYQGDSRLILSQLEDESVHCSVTSPPYFSLRDYGAKPSEWPEVSYSPMPGLPEITIPAQSAALGLETTPEAYVGHLVLVFREVYRVLRDDGVLWLNLGDTYASGEVGRHDSVQGRQINGKPVTSKFATRQRRNLQTGIPRKNLLGIPFRVAFALQADGWYLRCDVLWQKKNGMRESVTDRPTRVHEYVFLLSKRPRYFYDHYAIKEPAKTRTDQSGKFVRQNGKTTNLVIPGQSATVHREEREDRILVGRNRNSIWPLATAQFPGPHFAVMPESLVELCIKAGTSERGCCPACGAPYRRIVKRSDPQPAPRNPNPVLPYTAGGMNNHGLGATTLHMVRTEVTVGWQPTCTCNASDPVPCVTLDPFGGAGTVGLVSERLGRAAILCELNPEYAQMAAERIRVVSPMFTEVEVIEAAKIF